jgi:hypothetical protein
VTDSHHHLPLAQWFQLTCGYPIPQNQRSLIPEAAGVYVWLTRDGNVAYVGQTGDKDGDLCRRGQGCQCGLRGRLTTHKFMRDYQRDPAYGDLGGVRWLEIPDSTEHERRAFEKRLEDHYLPWWNKGSKTRVWWARRLGFNHESWPAPRYWHGADVDHDGDCASWAARLEVER